MALDDVNRARASAVYKDERSLTVILAFQDAENDKKDLPFKHQKENAECLSEAEGLLKDLFLDLDKAKKMKHPQTAEIEKEWVQKQQVIVNFIIFDGILARRYFFACAQYCMCIDFDMQGL